MRRGVWFWGISGGLAAAVVGGGLVLLAIPVIGLLGYLYGGPDPEDSRPPAEAFLTRLVQRDDAGAYTSLCAYERARITAAQFNDQVEDAGRPASYVFISDKASLDEPGRRALYRITVTDQAGRTRDTSITVKYDGEHWQACGGDVYERRP